VRPDVILNASAYTAVDRAESEPDVAMAINGHAPGFLAEEALRTNALFVHYSTDYVFDGTKSGAWVEEDEPSPLNVYGRTKLEGERAVQQVGGRYLIFRTSWVYGPHGNNFMLTMLRLGHERKQLRVVDDQVGAPTTSIALADATHLAIRRVLADELGGTEQWAGLYHMTCGGSTSWCGFAQAILTRAMGELAPEVVGIASEEYAVLANRPKNSVLSNERLLAKLGICLPKWELALEGALMNYESRLAAGTNRGSR
jgi:dTDP-4-dehydrorhamnose reductase